MLTGMERSLAQLAQVKPGGHPLRRAVVVHHQRRRILDAVIELVAESGYRSTSVAAIIKRAGVAKAKFYENFSSKEDAFLAAVSEGLEEAAQRMGVAVAEAEDATAALERGIAAALEFLDERPSLARACIVEAPSLGETVDGARRAAIETCVPLISAVAGERGGQLPADLEASILGGVYWLAYEAVASGEPDRLADLCPGLLDFVLLQLPSAGTQG